MNTNLKDIKPGIGLGDLKFGMSREEVEALLGKPDEKELSYDPEEDSSEAWHYDSLDLSMSFTQDQYWDLVAISVSSDAYLYQGKSLIGLKGVELLSLLEGWGIDDIEAEDQSAGKKMRHEVWTSDEIGIDFWLENDVVSEIQWGPFWSDEDTIEWPE